MEVNSLKDYLIHTMLFDENEIAPSLFMWATRYMEHCVVLCYYLQDFSEKIFKNTPLEQEINTLHTEALTHLNQWKTFHTKLKAKSNNVKILEETKTFCQHLNSLINFKQKIIETREKGKHPGSIKTVLIKHMVMEAAYMMGLLSGTMTREEEKQIAMKEMVQHIKFIGLEIEPIDAKHEKTIKDLIGFASTIESQITEGKLNGEQNVDKLKLSNEYLNDILGHSAIVSAKPETDLCRNCMTALPNAFIQHEEEETKYFLNRLRKLVGKSKTYD